MAGIAAAAAAFFVLIYTAITASRRRRRRKREIEQRLNPFSLDYDKIADRVWAGESFL